MFQEKISIKMKKAISLVLAGALFVGGAAFASTSKAADETEAITKISYNITVSGAAVVGTEATPAAVQIGYINNAGGWTQTTKEFKKVEDGTADYEVAEKDAEGKTDATEVYSLGWIDGNIGLEVQLNSFTINGTYKFTPKKETKMTIADGKNLALGDVWSPGKVTDNYENADGNEIALIDGEGDNQTIVVKKAADTKESTDPSADTKTSTSPSADTKTSTSPSADTKTSTSPSADTKTSTQPSASASVAPAATSAAPAAAVTPTPAAKSSSTNKCTKLKAAKKKYTIKKKGKTVKVVFNITTENRNKKTTDKIKKVTVAKKKIIKVTKKKLTNKAKSKKATITVKGLKKGTSKLTVKVGSKSASTKVTVKK